MKLDPQVAPILDALRAAPRLSTPPLAEARQRYDAMRSLGFGAAPDVGAVEELEVPGETGPLRARLYRPPTPARRGLLVHVHGGGFVFGSIEGYDNESRAFAALGACSVLTFEYRLAPEHPFPAAVNDTCAVLTWAHAHARDLGCDAAKLAIGGDSAGANLSAVAALDARDRGVALALQLLVYPCTDHVGSYASMQEFEEIPTLSRADVAWAWGEYLQDLALAGDWRASPLRCASLAGAAPALVVSAECDVLRDEGEAYAHRLQAEGVRALLRRYDGLPHGCFAMGAYVDAARRAVEETCAFLRDALA